MRCPTLTELPSPPSGRRGWPWTEAGSHPDAAPANGHAWPRISVVMPSYNQGAFLEAAIRSVLLQGYPDVELVVVDGGSSDRSVDVIARYEPWLASWCSEPDGGCAHALNKGFARTTGDILGYLNSDDWYLPGCFPGVARAMEARPDAGVVYGNGCFAGPSERPGRPLFSDAWSLRRFAYRPSMLLQQATFFRRSALEKVGGFNESNRSCWDAELVADMALAGARFHRIEGFLGAFRVHGDSITGSARLRDDFRREIRRVREKILGRPETAADRAYALSLRLARFGAHPVRIVGDKRFVRSVLGRWSL